MANPVTPFTKVGLKKSRAKHTKGNLRPDFQPISDAERIIERPLCTRSTPHELKIARYRDKILELAASRMSKDTFDQLDSRSADLIDIYPDNTEIAIYSDFHQYLSFCALHDLPLLPFVDYALDRYLSFLLGERKSRSTIDRHIASLARWAKHLEYDDPRKSHKVITRIAKIRKISESSSRQAEGLRATHLNAALDVLNPLIPRDCQDITLLFVGWETMSRRSELISFNWTDFELQPDGSGLMRLRKSKTDKEKKGAYLYLSPYTSNILLGWRTRSKPLSLATPIFRGIYSDGRIGERLSTKGVERCYKRIALRLGEPPEIFSGHSTRVGSAQEMIERDIDSAKIMLSGRWETMGMLTHYASKYNAKKGGMADVTKQLAAERQIKWAELTEKSLNADTEAQAQKNSGEEIE